MKIPSQLKIGAHVVTVMVVPLGDDGTCGDYDCETATIRINEKLSQTMKEATLIHEILHVANSTLGTSEVGHSLLDSLSEQIYQVLKENKLLNEET